MKENIIQFLDEQTPYFRQIGEYIWNHPELGFSEFKSSQKLIDALTEHGFSIKQPVDGMETAFIATFDSGLPGRTVAFLAEYDALPELNHACGHNLIGTMSVAAAISLSKAVHSTGGKVIVFGTPAEETGGAKVPLSEKGYFNDVDVALMAHPFHRYEESGSSLAMEALQFDFFGKSAHAAASPYEGINALDAVIALFNHISALRQQLISDVRIHGIITEGGSAPNVIPDKTQAKFYVRANTAEQLPDLIDKVKNCANAAALATGCTVEMSYYELGYANLSTNEPLSHAFMKNLVALGVSEQEIHAKSDHGSSDIGNVSNKVPAIHPYIKITDEAFNLHTPEFCEAANSDRGYEGMIIGAKALALTGYDVLTDAELHQQIKDFFNRK